VPLCSSYPIEYAPSAAIWLAARTQPTQSAPAKNEIAGDRRTAAGNHPADGEVLLVGPPHGHLPGAEHEIELLRCVFPRATVLSGDQCKIDEVVARLPGASLVHFATHCRFRPDRPELSGLDLGDGWLRVPDLTGLKLRAELVTLSACATGPGQVRAGDEVIGLMRGFLSAGSARVLATLWPVSDEHTQAFMARFYGELGRAPANVALQRTMQTMLADTSDPYVWAPFVLYARQGEGG
jgi:CHAT domain-containing protein